MNPMLNIAIQAARKAGNFIIKQYELFNKKNINSEYIYNFIYKTHKTSDQIIINTIQKFYPLHAVITTYDKYLTPQKIEYNTNTTCWIINSIDNNINFVKQFPFLTLSIAVKFKNNIEIGVIYDPIHNELFSACRGRGAQLNGYKIRVGIAKTLNGSMLAISCIHKQQHVIINVLKKLNNQYTHFRYTGAIILDLAYVASGRIDGCLAVAPKNYQKLSSAALIIQESGGLITDFTGSSNYISKGNIIAGNPKINKILLSKI